SPAFAQDADRVDDRVAAFEKSRQHRLVVDRDIDQGNLPRIAHRPQELGALGVARPDRDRVAARRQPPDDIPPDKPGSAEHGDTIVLHGSPDTRTALVPELLMSQKQSRRTISVGARMLSGA